MFDPTDAIDRRRQWLREEAARTAHEQEQRTREQQQRTRRINAELDTAADHAVSGSVVAMRKVAALLAEKYGIAVEERRVMPAGVRAFAVWGTRTIVVPPIIDLDTFAVRLHEIGHILVGECSRRAPHRPDPRETRWHKCLVCETEAWRRAMALVPFSRPMHDKLRRSLLSYRRSTPGHVTARHALDTIAGTRAFAEMQRFWMRQHDLARLKREVGIT